LELIGRKPYNITEKAIALQQLIILSPHFPPSTLAGVHRARHLAKHLPAHGWRPIVIRADESQYTEQSDPELAALVSTAVRQVRTGAVPASLTRGFGIGDIGLRSYWHLGRALARTIASENPMAVLITGAPWYPMMLARMVKRRFGLPVVLDFQDPWVSAHSRSRPLWSKSGLAHQLALTLEPRALRGAEFITSVSDVQNAEMAARYPWLDPTRMAAIPIGGDPEDFESLRVRPPANPQTVLQKDRFNFSYVGTCLPRAEPLLRRLFRAIASMRDAEPELGGRVRFNFVGTSNQPDDRSNYRVKPIAEEEGVGDLVAETPQRVPFLEALSLLANSDVLLLIGSDEPHYTASKIYPALMSGRPYLSLFHQASSAHAILVKAGGGNAFSFATREELDALVPRLSMTLTALARDPHSVGKADPAAYAPYTAHAVAGKFGAIFEKLSYREANAASERPLL
jgi:Glycosyl transferase 4-like domain